MRLSIDNSPKLFARVAGILYLYIFAAGTFAELFVRSKLIVSDDAAVTAANIIANETLFRVGFTGELIISFPTSRWERTIYEALLRNQ